MVIISLQLERIPFDHQIRYQNYIMYMQDWVNRLDAFLQFNEENSKQTK